MTEQDTDRLLDRIEELEAQLAKVTVERDELDAAIKRQAGAARTLRQYTLSEVQHIKDNERKEYVATRTLDSERQANAILTDELETYHAALPRVYRMGLEDAATVMDHRAYGCRITVGMDPQEIGRAHV